MDLILKILQYFYNVTVPQYIQKANLKILKIVQYDVHNLKVVLNKVLFTHFDA